MRCAGVAEQLVEPLQRQRQMRPAFGARDGVHLVDDDRLHLGQRLARRRRQHQEQRLRRGDQDVRRLGDQLAAPRGRSVAGPHADADRRVRARRAARRCGRCRSTGCAGCVRRRRPAPSAATRTAPGCPPWRALAPTTASRSMAHRNAASVLPDPVGAMTSVLSPSAMADQACGLRGGGRGEGAGEPLAGQRAEPGEWIGVELIQPSCQPAPTNISDAAAATASASSAGMPGTRPIASSRACAQASAT